MTKDKTSSKHARPRFTLLVFGALIAMLVFGYLLAEQRNRGEGESTRALQQSLSQLRKDNELLTTKIYQLEAELVIISQREEQLRQDLLIRGEASRALKDELAFYRRIMAPEQTQQGFLLDGLQIKATNVEGHYQGSFVLLQQRQNKAVVKGGLIIEIIGSIDGEPASVKTGDSNFFPEGPVRYRFKYFQTVEWAFTLPQGFIPEYIQFSTSVYQYTTKRGEYARQFPWQEVVEQQ